MCAGTSSGSPPYSRQVHDEMGLDGWAGHACHPRDERDKLSVPCQFSAGLDNGFRAW